MPTRPQSSRWMLGAMSLALLLFIGWLAFNRPITSTLPDGTTFELSYLNIALTNEVVHGTILGRVLERWIPANGWSVGKYPLVRPQRLTLHNRGRSDLLVAAIKLRPGSPRLKNLLLPLPHQPMRFQIIGDDGYGYANDYASFQVYPDGVFAHVVAPNFPRDSAQLRLRLEERHPEAPTGWREIAMLSAPNPKPGKAEAWTVDQGRRIRLADGIEMELGELTIFTNTPYPREPWVNSAMLPVRFSVDGRLAINWGLHSASISDALGNHESSALSSYWSNGWVWHPIERPLSPHVPWRFDAQVARTTGFPETNLFTVAMMDGVNSLSTNLGGVAVSVTLGRHDQLTIELMERPADQRLDLIAARLPDWLMFGQDGHAFSQHRFSKSLGMRSIIVHDETYRSRSTIGVWPDSGNALETGLERDLTKNYPAKHHIDLRPSSIEVAIAIHSNYPVQFTLQPKLDSAPPANPKP